MLREAEERRLMAALEAQKRNARFAELLEDAEVLRRVAVIESLAESAGSAFKWDLDQDMWTTGTEKRTGIRNLNTVSAARLIILLGFLSTASEKRPLVEEDAALAYHVLERFPFAAEITRESLIDRARRTVEQASNRASREWDPTFFPRWTPLVEQFSAVARAHGADSVSRDLTTSFSELRGLV